MTIRRRRSRGQAPDTSWDDLADWYDGWAGAGSEHHRALAIPAVLELLALRQGERLLEIGCGPAPLAPAVARAGASYTGVDLSPRMVAHARARHGRRGRFLVADAGDLAACPKLGAGAFDAAVFLLSLQNIEPLEPALASAAWALRPGGRLVLLLTHPCFRIQRQSGWGWDAGRKLRYRRVDRYLTPLRVPLRPPSSGRGAPASSFHRPLGAYVNGMAAHGLALDGMREVARPAPRGAPPAEARAEAEFPLFLALRGRKG
ncbi:MAG TPA: class I SAM-dependent methyltransferase [Chloroflexaceae bacterium]|nr:class I SAM-dependent methyltransferase [Chloroflexaceae bacterium]